MGKRHISPHFGPFWAYLRTPPQGVELLVWPIVTSLFCPKNASSPEFLGWTPLDPPQLKPTFSRGVGGGGLVGEVPNVEKMTPLFCPKS